MTFVDSLAKFSVGQLVLSFGASSELTQTDVLQGLIRHMSGDWGELDEYDWKANDSALKYGCRLFSRYITFDGAPFWIITEHDRSLTTILLPHEY